jgi:glycerol uptake facilitator-like aquaporin
MRATIAEFIGTFTLVLVGVGAVATGQGLLVGAFSHGLIVAGLIYA